MSNKEEILKQKIHKLIYEIYDQKHKNKKFIPGKTWIQYAGGVFDDKEIFASVSSLIDGWFGLGKHAETFENKLAKFLGVKGSILVNSGSSANLLSIASLMSPLFSNRLSKGDEVITSACGFPTTVNPIVLYDLIPVFVDVNPQTYNLNVSDLEKAVTKKTKAVMIAHTLGNPCDMDAIMKFCQHNNLLLIEDNCDALGSKYNNQYTGSFGILSTQSFYPPHHLTMGEGGAVNYNDFRFERITRSLRDWGRSCWCRGDEKRTLGACQVRFNFRVDGKPYDHKYMFNQIGYNLKPIEPQAAMGVVQLTRLPKFIKKRAVNFERLFNYSKQWQNYFILPQKTPKSQPCWFAFPLTIKDDAPFNRHQLVMYLEQRMIQTRPLFAGNITKQLAYKDVNYRKIGNLDNCDRILHNTFFLGIYPALTYKEIDFIAQSINDFLKKF